MIFSDRQKLNEAARALAQPYPAAQRSAPCGSCRIPALQRRAEPMSSGSGTHGVGGRIPRLYVAPRPAARPAPAPDAWAAVTPSVVLPGLAALAACALAAAFGLAPCAFVVLAADLSDAVEGLRERDAADAACVAFITLRAVVARRPGPLATLILVAGPWKRRRALALLIVAAAAYDVYVDGFVVRRWPLAVGVFVMAHAVNVARTFRRSKYG